MLGFKYLKDIDKQPINEYKLGLDFTLSGSDYSKESLFNGIVDYICVKNSILYLIDFKSGRAKEQRFQDYNQLLFYAIHFFEKYRVPKIIISFVYVEHDLENSLELELKYLDNYKKELLQCIKQIEHCTDFKANKSKLCEWCGFKDIC